jgi:D-alanine--(R)-lactate ligase
VNTNKLRLLVLYGGASEEHGVSVKSAREFSRRLNSARYDTIYVYIDRDGIWRPTESPDSEPAQGTFAALSTDRGNKGLIVLKGGSYRIMPVDAAFPMLHGKYGEDGVIQGALEASGIPYAGCGIAASALCMDKALTYMVVSEAGVRVPRHRTIGANAVTTGGLKYPLFVKPARSGSSFGVSKVSEAASLEASVRAALEYDDKVLLEEAVEGLEIGCALMGNGSNLIAGGLDQIGLSGGFFRIHQESKPEQGSENATITVPAPIPEAARTLAVETAKTVFRALGCRGLARVDMFLTPDGRITLNEVNTMPGFTSYSRYPRMMACAGFSLGDVIDRLIDLALEKEGRAL